MNKKTAHHFHDRKIGLIILTDIPCPTSPHNILEVFAFLLSFAITRLIIQSTYSFVWLDDKLLTSSILFLQRFTKPQTGMSVRCGTCLECSLQTTQTYAGFSLTMALRGIHSERISLCLAMWRYVCGTIIQESWWFANANISSHSVRMVTFLLSLNKKFGKSELSISSCPSFFKSKYKVIKKNPFSINIIYMESPLVWHLLFLLF